MNERQLTIVALDDDPIDLELLNRHLLNQSDWSVEYISFSDPKAALTGYGQYNPDLIFLDYHLGAETGLEMIPQFLAHGYQGPIIMLTGRGDEKVAVECLQAGATDYMPKEALSTASVRRSVENAIDKYKLKSELENNQKILKKTNTELVHQNREIGSFYQTLSHELKTPLTSLREFVSIIRDGIAGPVTPEQHDYLGIALDCCDQMALYVNDLLDVTRLDTGKLDLNLRPMKLDELIPRIVQSLTPIAEDKGIGLHCEIGNNSLEALVDKERIFQILNNLIGNALKFTNPGGTVCVQIDSGTLGDGTARIAVHDSGRGISKKHLPHIFERLYQTDRDDSGSKGGLGLGLKISRDLVILHKGTLRAESVEGEGSTFIVELPLLPKVHQRNLFVGS